MKTNIIRVKYEDDYIPNSFSGKGYSYYSAINVEVGDLVIAPTVHGDKIARVSEINISKHKVEIIKPYLKLIKDRIDKDKYLQTREILKEVS